MKKNFAMLIDRRGWCFDRTALALEKYHKTNWGWQTYCAIEPDGKPIKEIGKHPLYRIGGMSLCYWFLSQRLIDLRGSVLIPTLASFVDVQKLRDEMSGFIPHIRAFIINDQRMLEDVIGWNKPIIYSPDKVDHEIFFPEPKLRPKKGPLRIGWAGSVKFWQGVKNINKIIDVLKETKGVQLVRQDRELDGQKSPEEMRTWFNGLDAYICANESRTCTPVPILESIACGLPVLTTRCGELFPIIESHRPEWIIEKTTEKEIKKTIETVRDQGRQMLHDLGMRLHRNIIKFISWQCGEANRVTRAFATMLGEAP
jgi:glycosyltransferase involved in cell wall biosynthesis